MWSSDKTDRDYCLLFENMLESINECRFLHNHTTYYLSSVWVLLCLTINCVPRQTVAYRLGWKIHFLSTCSYFQLMCFSESLRLLLVFSHAMCLANYVHLTRSLMKLLTLSTSSICFLILMNGIQAFLFDQKARYPKVIS